MGQFILFAGLFLCLAVAFAISALWQKSRGLAIALAIALPLAAGGLYWFKGTPAALEAANRTPPKTVDEAVVQLENLTRADPKNYSDMATLARAYMAQQRFDKARDAYARALALQPEDSTIYVEYAEALLRTSPDHRFPPQAVELLRKTLAKEPDNQRALFFMGLKQRMEGDAAGAVATWEKLLALLDDTTSHELRKQVEAARKDAGMPPLPVEQAIRVEVRLDPVLARELKPGAVLYVFAKKLDGAGPPVAVKRIIPTRFPVQVELGDSDSPMPTAKLFSQQKVVLMARLTQSGQPTATSGDIESDPLQFLVNNGALADLTLNRSVP
jgi:cytochrome c-type biogenesis protein CcmH